ncbi:hypothetical protein [Palleronia sp. LCG004]|uniref:hypothetical protein n=1 Tax=Palleronia sp. LCG004 TaxID=3079304 RepID=UPI002943B14D|nr:hypothetical protein [Palleronia sp. LCG004]WOI56362.1 hypothetical protein RVY76_00790 [Palleronia sp. LCG004]
MPRLYLLCLPLLLGACSGGIPYAGLGVSVGPGGVRTSQSVGVVGPNTSIMVRNR